MAKKVRASELIFISKIKRDGSGVEKIDEKESDRLANVEFCDDVYTTMCLSITHGTYIASAFNSYVVKFKST